MTPPPLYPFQNFHLKPKLKRHWRKAKMTIAAGFVCLDGIIFLLLLQQVPRAKAEFS